MKAKTLSLPILADTYFRSRPNLELPRPRLAVFFLACSGSGKSTLRRQIVEQLGAIYVCNDEVRDLLNKQGQTNNSLKEIVEQTRDRILSETPNHFIVYDNNISNYYMHHDSYLNVAMRANIPYFIIAINLPESLLAERIAARGLPLLSPLEKQLGQQRLAEQNLTPDFIITNPTTSQPVIDTIKTKLAGLSA